MSATRILSALHHGFGQLKQYFLGSIETNATIGNALPIDEFLQFFTGDILSA